MQRTTDKHQQILSLLPAIGFPGKKQQYKRQYGPYDHEPEAGMVGGNIINSDSIHQLTAPASIQHPSYKGLKQGGS